ncbi:transmembrane signal receptor [Lithospermum erythrorhizon]|uniref:Transmembrane signal receptor n=1 Tax=Lithospermum erythrorhizon TaxID=34254 RepID=A0AAV3NQM7_LITER
MGKTHLGQSDNQQEANLIGIKDFTADLAKIQEPHSLKQARLSEEWMRAMAIEIQGLEENRTWEIVDLPKGVKPIGWVDYFNSFSHVGKVVTVRLVLAIAASKAWQIFQLHINNAFLHGYLDEDIYMLPPEGYEKDVFPQVYKLHKSLFGLKQASRKWNVKFTSTLITYGFKQSYHDNCLFTYTTNSCFLVLVVYVDDILLTGNSEQEMLAIKKVLHEKFTIKDLGVAKYFLDIEIAWSTHGMYLSQQKYIKDIVHDLKMETAKVAVTLLAQD